MRLIIAILLNGLLVYVVSWLLAGVYIENYLVAIITGLILGLINFFVKPVVTLLTLPLTILTLGLFLLIINGVMVLLADWLIVGFDVRNLFWGILFSLLLMLLNMLTGGFDLKGRRKK